MSWIIARLTDTPFVKENQKKKKPHYDTKVEEKIASSPISCFDGKDRRIETKRRFRQILVVCKSMMIDRATMAALHNIDIF